MNFIIRLLIGTLISTGLGYSEVIDRVVSVVDGKIITASDVRQERRLRTVFGEAADSDQAVLQDLVDRALVEDQISQFPELAVTDEDVQTALRDLKPSTDLTVEQLEDGVRKRILRARFFEVRFRQFVTVTDEELQKYYTEVFLPEARARQLQPIPTFEEAAATIRDNVIDEKMTQDVQLWLDTIRRRSNIETFE